MSDQLVASAYESAGEPVPSDPLTAAQMQTEIDPEKLDKLGYSLSTRRDEWVQARAASKVESRWMEDLDQYHGRDQVTKNATNMMDSVEAGFPQVSAGVAKTPRSKLFVNITRPKTNAAEARIAQMLFPTDDRNFGIKPTPNPKLARAVAAEIAALSQPQQSLPGNPESGAAPAIPVDVNGQQPGASPQLMGQPQLATSQPNPSTTGIIGNQPQPPSAQSQMQAALDAAKGMENTIWDHLVECGYNAEGRAMLHDCAVLGTGVLKGPIAVNRTRKCWSKKPGTNVYVLEIVQDTTPATERVDPWNVFPDPRCGENIHQGEGVFERKLYTAKQVRDLAKQPGYLKAQIAKVLEEGPQTPLVQNDHDRQKDKDNGTQQANRHYEVWEYWGDFNPEDMRTAGVDVADGATDIVSGCIVVINRHVVKGFLNPIETGDIPYDFMPYEKVDGSVFGYGVPRLCRAQQSAVNAGWRQMLDNSALSIGPQIVIDRSRITPADKNWELTGRKIWWTVEAGTDDVEKAFQTFDIQNHQQDIAHIIELAMKFIDIESGVPQLMQGENGAVPDTVGGMQLLMNSSNVVLTRIVKQFDDLITRPHISRYYDWEMCYGDDDTVKGDYQVDARGSSALLVRDIQHQALIQLGQFMGNGVVSPMVNWENWFRELLKAQKIDPSDIMKTDAEIAQAKNTPPPQSPEQIRANAALQVAQIKAQSDLQQTAIETQGEQAYIEKEQEIAQQNANAQVQELEMQRQLKILEYAIQQKTTLESVKADLAKTAMVEGTKRQLAAIEQQAQANENHLDRQHDLNKSQQMQPQI